MKSIRGLSVLQGRDAGPSTALPAVAPVGMTNRRSQMQVPPLRRPAKVGMTKRRSECRSPDSLRSLGMTKRETVAPVGMTNQFDDNSKWMTDRVRYSG